MSLYCGNATSNRINHGTMGSWNPSAFTVCQWYEQTSATGSQYLWAKSAGGNNGVRLWVPSGTAEYRVNWDGSTTLEYNTNNASIGTGTWYFVACTIDTGGSAGSLVKIYHGDLTTSATARAFDTPTDGASWASIATAEWTWGNRESNTNRGWKGNLAKGIVFDAVLTLEEIQVIQHFMGAHVAHAAKLRCELGYNGVTNVPDWSGNGYTGTVTGATVADHVPISVNRPAAFYSFTAAAAPSAPTPAVEDAITVGDTPTMLAYQPTYLVAPGDELITVNDLPTLSLSELFLTASDDVTVAEDVTVRLPFLVPAVQDDLTVGEDVTALLPFLVPAVQDDVTVGEVVDAFVFHLHIDVSDGVTVDDTNLDVAAGEVPAKPVASDAVTVNEVVGLSLSELFLSVEDAVTVGDTPTMEITESLNASVEDGITVGEDVTAFVFPLFVSAQDDITVGEDLDELITKLKAVAEESVTVGEDVTMRVPFLALDEAESVTVGEVVSAGRVGGTLLIDSLGAEAVTVGESVQVSTGGGAGDDTAAIRQRFRIVGERRYGNKRAIKA